MKDFSKVRIHVFHCEGGACLRAGAKELTQALRDSIQEQSLNAEFHTTRTLCNGACECAPVVVVHPKGLVYGGLATKDANAWIQAWSEQKWFDTPSFPVAAYSSPSTKAG